MTLRRLELDFVARPHRRRWPGYALLAAALVVAGDLLVRYQAAQTAIDRSATARSLLSVERPALPAATKERLDEQAQVARSVVHQLGLPWAAMIRALEEAATPDVAILQLQPDAQQRLLRVTAEARDGAAMLDYVRRLTAAKALANAHLVNHQVQLDDPQRPIQFSLQAGLVLSP